MKSPHFRYAAPERFDDVLALLTNADDGRVIAGGQSLVPMMAMRLAQPDLLVDLRNVSGLDRISVDDEGIKVGAMVSQSSLDAHAAAHPLVREAIMWIAHPQIRNRGTVVGSLAHADPAAELPAVAVAIDARLRAQGPAGARWIAARDFFDSYFTTTLRPGEVVASAAFPWPVRREGWAIAEVARRHGDFALAGIVARLVLAEDGSVAEAVVVPFAVADRARPSDAAAAALVGADPTADVLRHAAGLTVSELAPPSDVHASAEYRRHAAAVLAERALRRAVEIARSRDQPEDSREGRRS